MKLLRGLGRKLALPVLLLPVLGWLLYVIGFAAFNNRNNYYQNSTTMPQRAGLFWFPHWVVLIVGPFVFVCSFLHLLIGRWFTGILTNFLSSLYLVCCGAVIHYWAVELFDDVFGLVGRREYNAQLASLTRPKWLIHQYWGLWPLLEWVGVLSSALFLTFYMMMWPCFKTKKCYKNKDEHIEEQEMEEGEWDDRAEGEEEGEDDEEEEGEEGGEEEEGYQEEQPNEVGGEQEEVTPSAPPPQVE